MAAAKRGTANRTGDASPTTTPRPNRPATLREVAAAAQVDPSTASRALRPATQNMVRPVTVRRVLATAEMLGYRVNPFARGLKDQRSMTIGMVLPDLANPLFPPIVRGIEDGLRKAGYALILANTDRDQAREQELVDVFLQRRVDALVLATAERDYPLLEQLIEQNIPVVLVNRTIDQPLVSMVSSDDRQGVGLAVQHLAELGHRRIAHVGGSLSVSTGFLRYQHFMAWMYTLGLPVDPELIVLADWFTKDLGAKACDQLLDRTRDFTAIVAANDLLALGCVRALRARGLAVPDDVSVVGYNGSRYCDDFNPPMTSVHVPKYVIGTRVAELVIKAVEEPGSPPVNMLVPTTLQVRESTCPPRQGDR
jgi:LacI family transcriptional regulator